MIVGYQPGGNIRDARVVLKHDEKLPNKFNTKESIVYRESEDNAREWVLVKPKFSILPEDSPLLSQPALPEPSLLLTIETDGDTVYEHRDIIRLDEPNDDNKN